MRQVLPLDPPCALPMSPIGFRSRDEKRCATLEILSLTIEWLAKRSYLVSTRQSEEKANDPSSFLGPWNRGADRAFCVTRIGRREQRLPRHGTGRSLPVHRRGTRPRLRQAQG